MLDSHHFWLSPTPDVKSKGWDERKYTRGACCAIFKENATGLRFFLMISHMPLGKEANANAAPVILERAKEYNPESLPSFFVGDLNTREWTKSSELFRTNWNDTFLTVPADVRKGSVGTFNKRGGERGYERRPEDRLHLLSWGRGQASWLHLRQQAVRRVLSFRSLPDLR